MHPRKQNPGFCVITAWSKLHYPDSNDFPGLEQPQWKTDVLWVWGHHFTWKSNGSHLSSLWCSGWFCFTMCRYWCIRKGPSWLQKDLDLVVTCVETIARNKEAFLINILRNWFLQLKNGSIIILSRGAHGWSLDIIPFSAFYSSIIIIKVKL